MSTGTIELTKNSKKNSGKDWMKEEGYPFIYEQQRTLHEKSLVSAGDKLTKFAKTIEEKIINSIGIGSTSSSFNQLHMDFGNASALTKGVYDVINVSRRVFGFVELRPQVSSLPASVANIIMQRIKLIPDFIRGRVAIAHGGNTVHSMVYFILSNTKTAVSSMDLVAMVASVMERTANSELQKEVLGYVSTMANNGTFADKSGWISMK